MKLTVKSAETLLASHAGSVAAKDFDRDDERILYQIVVNHAVANDR